MIVLIFNKMIATADNTMGITRKMALRHIFKPLTILRQMIG